MNKAGLISKANKIRNTIVDISYSGKCGHIGSALSIVEILTFLYFDKLTLDGQDRDHFILSKGHACTALYATLYEKGLINKEVLSKFNVNNGLLNRHSDKNLDYGIEFSTGSLGHGLSIACGLALGLKKDNLKGKVFVLLGDGECDEGSVWEAILFANQFKLDNLIVLIDYNKWQALGGTNEVINLEPFFDKWKSFNCDVFSINGHDFDEINQTYNTFKDNSKPKVVILNTIKGKGLTFLENTLKCHYQVLTDKEYELAKENLR